MVRVRHGKPKIIGGRNEVFGSDMESSEYQGDVSARKLPRIPVSLAVALVEKARSDGLTIEQIQGTSTPQRTSLDRYLNPDDWWLYGEEGPPETTIFYGPDYSSLDQDDHELLDEQGLNEFLDQDPSEGYDKTG